MDKAQQQRVKQRFGARLRELRAARGKTQEEVAFTAGIDRSYFSAIECGKKNVSLINIQRIADALGVGTGELFGE